MSVELYYTEIIGAILPIITLSALIAFTIALILMLLNILINAATGRGLRF